MIIISASLLYSIFLLNFCPHISRHSGFQFLSVFMFYLMYLELFGLNIIISWWLRSKNSTGSGKNPFALGFPMSKVKSEAPWTCKSNNCSTLLVNVHGNGDFWCFRVAGTGPLNMQTIPVPRECFDRWTPESQGVNGMQEICDRRSVIKQILPWNTYIILWCNDVIVVIVLFYSR